MYSPTLYQAIAKIYLPVCLFLISCSQPPSTNQESPAPTDSLAAAPTILPFPEVGQVFSEYAVRGCFVWYDFQSDRYYIHHPELRDSSYAPASSFKIMNALIALETGAVRDTTEVIPWDGVDRGWNKWNMNQTLGSALRFSAFWAFQEIARRVDSIRPGAYPHFLSAAAYGNQTISDSIDQFWVDNSLRISPMQQIAFLVKLYRAQLPFQKRSMNLVKAIMRIKETPEYVLRGKTGWARIQGRNIAWYVGYAEVRGKAYFFCTNVENLNKIEQKKDFRRIYVSLTEGLIAAILQGDYPNVHDK